MISSCDVVFSIGKMDKRNCCGRGHLAKMATGRCFLWHRPLEKQLMCFCPRKPRGHDLLVCATYTYYLFVHIIVLISPSAILAKTADFKQKNIATELHRFPLFASRCASQGGPPRRRICPAGHVEMDGRGKGGTS